MYRPPNTDPSKFRNDVNMITSNFVMEKKEIILGMDHNLDILKCGLHKHTQLFLDDLLDKKIYPTITRLTQICHNTATLIDNIFVSERLHKYFESAIILEDISDHLLTLALLKQTKLVDDKPIELDSRKLNPERIKVIKQKLLLVDWTRHLNADNCSDNFDLFLSKLNEIMDSVSPITKVRISAKQKYIKPWMTRGLEISGWQKLHLYKETLKASATHKDITKYKVTFNKVKHCLKLKYFKNNAVKFASDSRKIIRLLNQTIGKTTNKGSIISYIIIDGLKTHTPNKIVNEFGKILPHCWQKNSFKDSARPI